METLKAIKDTCPTCGQHIPGAHKPDTSSLREQVKIKSADLVATEETKKKPYESSTKSF